MVQRFWKKLKASMIAMKNIKGNPAAPGSHPVIIKPIVRGNNAMRMMLKAILNMLPTPMKKTRSHKPVASSPPNTCWERPAKTFPNKVVVLITGCHP